MSDVGVALGFWGLGALAVGAALGILVTQNLLHAVLLLILSFVALAGLFITLTADFIAVAQVLIYAGAVGVLVIFAVMLTPSSSRVNADTAFFGPGFIIGGLVAAAMGFVVFKTPWPMSNRAGFDGTVNLIGDALTNRWALPFEIASIVLIAAMVGAIVLVRAAAPVEGPVADEPVAEIPQDQTGEAPERALAVTAGSSESH
jgi:NADH:ubiquinone oxidoreductase subunit 6 (subunit J)